MEKELLQEQLLEFHPKTSFTILSKGRVVSIRFEEITHVSKYGNETVIYTASLNPSEGGTCYKTFHSLQEIMNDLPVNDFFRVHRSHIVSFEKMGIIDNSKIRIGECIVPISKYYKIQMIKRLGEILERVIMNSGRHSSK